MRLLVTRPEPECERTAALLRARGHEVLVLPLLRIEPIADAELGVGPWAAALFTSTNAVRAIAVHRRFGEIAALPAYVVGQRTCAATVAAGFAPVMSADGDVNALVRLIVSKRQDGNIPVIGANGVASRSLPSYGEGSGVGVERGGTGLPQSLAPPPQPSPTRGEGVAAAQPQLIPERATSPFLYCAGEERAGDLAGALQSCGFRVETAIVYRAAPEKNLTPAVCAALAAGQVDAVLHYSARTAAALLAAATNAGIRDLSIQIRHFCLSAQVAAPLLAAGADAIEVANEPNEQSLLACLDRG